MDPPNNFEDTLSKELQVTSEKKQLISSEESVKKNSKSIKSSAAPSMRSPGSIISTKTRTEGTSTSSPNSIARKSTASKSSVKSNGDVPKRRNSTVGAVEKQLLSKKQHETMVKMENKVSQAVSVPSYLTLSESRRASLPPNVSKSLPSVSPKVKKPSPASSTDKSLPTSSKSNISKQDSIRKPSAKPSSSLDSTAGTSIRRTASKVSSPISRSPSVTSSSSKLGSLSTSFDRGSPLSGRRKASTPDSRESRFMMLPKVEIKAGDDVRLDLRGHRVRSLKVSGLNLSQNLEFIYLRDNLLSSIEGIEILKRVKVLDLSFNDFKGPGFEPLENCKFLQQLYLAGNQISSLASLPQLPNLEFLSVAQNKLKSLSMASQPRLQVLAASKNKISTLQGFPYLPALEHLRVEENPILKMPHLEAASILLVGPTLKKFNDRDLSRSEQELAKRYPAHTSFCLRDGWEFCRPELSAESTFGFLVHKWKNYLPPGYTLKEASVDQPFEEDVCRCHFIFTKDQITDNDSELILKFQWYIGENTSADFIAIGDALGETYMPKNEHVGKFLKVECTPILAGTEYPPMFAISSPVSPGTGHPKVINLHVHGELVEGNMIKGSAEIAWCGGTPGKGVASWLRRRWNSTPVVIPGAEYEEYKLTLDDIDSSLVFMYTPVTEEGAKGEPQYAMTDFVKAAPPSVYNLRILGDVVEGNTIKGIGNYFGGKEGPSKFEWLRENKESGEFLFVTVGTAEFVLSKEDVGRRLAFAYIPINFEGQEGESRSVITEIVKQAPPKVIDLYISGDLREGSKVTVAAVLTGGTEGSSKVQWFKTKFSKFVDEKVLEALSTSKIAKAYRLPLSAVGFYIVAKFTPVAPDGEFGEPAYAVSEKAVETLPPSLNFLSVTGEYYEGEILTASYGYVGGHEGKSIYNWFLHEVESDIGVLIPEATGLLQYSLTKESIGKFVSFKCTPVRNDEAIGKARTCMGLECVRPGSPRLLSLQILGKEVEGSTLHVVKKYWGGEEGNSIFRWFLTSPDGIESEIKGATTASYTPSKDDIGSQISVSCEPIRNDWARGLTIISEQVGPIIAGPPTCKTLEFDGSMVEGQKLGFTTEYSGGEQGNCIHEWFCVRVNGIKDKLSGGEYVDLTLEHVGRRVELVYTPVREDGLRGKPRSVVSDAIAPADPVGVELLIPDCSEDKIVVPYKSYYGGQEGVGAFTWYRCGRKLHEYELREISDAFENVLLVGKSPTYLPTLEDVGAYLALCWVPTRVDGKCGDTLFTISNDPVSPAPPEVSNIQILESSTGVYHGTGVYYGGFEGSSMFSWYRETSEGTITLICDSNSTTYEVTDEDYNHRLLFGYTPVRSDSIAGELRLSVPTDIILPELPKIQMLTLRGKAIEGEILTAVEVIPETEIQQRVWDKYKKDITYQWFCSSQNGEHSFEPLPSQRSGSYKVLLENVGRCLKCECFMTDVFGRSSEPASVVTAPISPGLPKMDKLEIEGRGFHTNLYAVRGIYSGGREGKSRIQWLRSMVGSPDLISIPGEIGKMYEANVDDVGYRLVAVYTPVREDGVEGPPVSASTEPIAVEPDVHKEVKQKLELGAVKFEALCDKDRSLKKAPGVTSLERRILEVNRKRVKVVKPGSKTSFPATEIRGSYAPPFHVEIFRNDQHRLKIVVDGENEVELMVQTRHMRDVIVLVIRGLAQRFNSTSLNSLLKIET